MSDPLYTPKERLKVMRQNIGSLPRWMRRQFRSKEHTNEREETRRRRQINDGTLNPESRGTTEVK